jgi:Arc/MetJ-type ribon-helix-helix transcriptional regulator
MVRRRRAPGRAKISTTVAPETAACLRRLISRGEASSLSHAIDVLVRRHLDQEEQAALERRMAAYYENLDEVDVAEHSAWGAFAEGELAARSRP